MPEENMQTDETKIALIGKDISFINENIKEIRQTIQSLSGVFVQASSYENDKKAFDTRMERLEKSSNLWRWLSPTLASVAGSILTLLVISYISTLK